MEITKNIHIKGSHNKPILTDVCYEKTNKQKPIVVFCHGYKGFKDWGVFDKMAASFTEKELFLVKFNFSHNGGTVDQPIDFPDLKAFGENNLSKEKDDLKTVLDWLFLQDIYKKEVDFNNITLIGHSRGGGIVTLKASEDSRISRLVTWASVSDYESRFPKGELLEAWKKMGVAYIENARTKQQMPHYIQFYNDFVENKERLTIRTAATKLTIPHLIVHGTSDATVSIEEAKLLHSWSPKSELLLIKDADHGFGAKHPWEETDLPEDFNEVLRASIRFIKNT